MGKLMTRAGVAVNGGQNGGLALDDQGEVWGDRIPARFVRDDKVVAGKDDWLFLDNDRNGFLRQYAGEVKLSEEQLEEWRRLLEARIARVEEFGARYHFMVVPESCTVYPEKLPDGISAGDERTIQQLMRHLSSNGSPAKLIYPVEELRAEKGRGRVYRTTDSHWNEVGSFAGYRRLARELEQDVPIHEVGEEEIWFYETEILGDLGYKLGLPATPEWCARYMYARAVGLYDNRIESHGSLVITECSHAPPTKCVVFGDSASYAMLPFLAQTFGRLVFAQASTLDYGLIAEERPDVVVSLMVERYMIVVPGDSTARSIRELEAEKRAKGRFRPRVLTWDPEPEVHEELRAASVETVETVRAHFLSRNRQEDATFVSVMAYAGLSPTEALRLSWRQLENGSLAAEPPLIADEDAEATQRRHRSVPLLEPLADDLAAWRAACGYPRRGYVFPELRKRDWQKWMRKDYHRAIRLAGRAGLGPGALSDGFAALLIHDGASPSDVARLMGIEREVVLARYWYLFEQTAPNANTPASASERIRQARDCDQVRVRTGSLGRRAISRLRLDLLGSQEPGIGWDPLPQDSLGVRPLSVETVEKIRARLLSEGNHEEATFVSVVAYVGLRQDEAASLKWREVRDGRLEIEAVGGDPLESGEARSLRERSLPLLEPVAEDLAQWRTACGSPQRGWVFPNLRTRNWLKWVHGEYRRAARPAGRGRKVPYYLRHTFCKLLIEAGTSLDEVARQMAFSPKETVLHYGHLFDDARVHGPVSATARIRDARAILGTGRPFGFRRSLGRLRGLKTADNALALPASQPDAAVQEDS